ncbi:hypothetical protein Plo01_78000 [Planobispora longispora]|uniref:Uncharacterized protein n=1 Tax=Planobispora longispora TaxID=28887 RepID=A0A8J3RR51_9ACTN|nr:hypothetical protein Plo01_78000 [Planobispora longispora]
MKLDPLRIDRLTAEPMAVLRLWAEKDEVEGVGAALRVAQSPRYTSIPTG